MIDRETRKHEAETLAYKQFMKVAKRVSNLQYGKWKVVPSPEDPLRKFTLEKDFGWATVKYSIYMQQYAHRGNYTESRYDYRPLLKVSGLFGGITSQGLFLDSFTTTSIKLRPRMAKKLIEMTDTIIILKFYETIEIEKAKHDKIMLEKALFKAQINKVPGLVEIKNIDHWDNTKRGNIDGCPFYITLYDNTVELVGNMSYDDLKIISEKMGWGK